MKVVAPVLSALLTAGLLWLLTAPLHGGLRHGAAVWLSLGGLALLAGVGAVVRARRKAAGRRTGVIAVIPVPRAGRRSMAPVADNELRKG